MPNDDVAKPPSKRLCMDAVGRLVFRCDVEVWGGCGQVAIGHRVFVCVCVCLRVCVCVLGMTDLNRLL